MDIMLIKQWDGSFKPAYDSDYQKAKKIKVDSAVSCKITKPRNIKFHRKFFGLINLVFQNQEIYNNPEHLREELTKKAGFYEVYTNHLGVLNYKAKSISFVKMSQEEFEYLYDRFLDAIEEIFKFDKESIRKEIEQHF
jgi:hypothetical protein